MLFLIFKLSYYISKLNNLTLYIFHLLEYIKYFYNIMCSWTLMTAQH